MKNVEISEETLRGLYLILCGVSTNHDFDPVYSAAKPIMEKAHAEILRLGNEKGFDSRGGDIK